jgi:hypothetical protein
MCALGSRGGRCKEENHRCLLGAKGSSDCAAATNGTNENIYFAPRATPPPLINWWHGMEWNGEKEEEED